jgi:hypothetical protein
VPPPVIGKYMFLVCASSIRRLDLESGEVRTQRFEREMEFVMAWFGDRIYYLGKFKSSSLYEIGTLTTDTLALVPFLTLDGADVGKLSFFAAASRDGSRIALVSKKAAGPGTGEETRLLIYSAQSLERTILIGSEREIDLGNPEWSPDGRLIYASYCRKLKGNKCTELGILEVSTTGQPMREVPLLRCQECESGFQMYFQVALSPDGKTAAAYSTYLEIQDGIADTDRALYLVDLESPDRKVTKVPIPPIALALPSDENEKKKE